MHRAVAEVNEEGTVAAAATDFSGYFGIEEKYNDLLAGNPVQIWVPRDPNKATEIPRVPNGTTLVLTLNRDLQAKVESILDKALTDYGSPNGAIIVTRQQNRDEDIDTSSLSAGETITIAWPASSTPTMV